MADDGSGACNELHRLLQEARPDHLRQAHVLCCEHAGRSAGDLVNVIARAVGEERADASGGKRPSKDGALQARRKGALALIEGLLHGESGCSKEYLPHVERALKATMIVACLGTGQAADRRGCSPTAARSDRSIAKMLKNILRLTGDAFRRDVAQLEEIVNRHLGWSDEEQELAKKKKALLDFIERDREMHRSLREACWSRHAVRGSGSDARAERAPFNGGQGAMSLADMTGFNKNIQAFLALNAGLYSQALVGESILLPLADAAKSRDSREEAAVRNGAASEETSASSASASASAASAADAAAAKKPCLIVVLLDETLYNVSDLPISPKSIARMDAIVEKVARRAFFYDDCASFEQPHVRYYCEDDDGRDLGGYVFEADALGAFARDQRLPAQEGGEAGGRRRPPQKFYSERSFRYRVAGERYDARGAKSLLRGNVISVALREDFDEIYSDLDRQSSRKLSRRIADLERLVRLDGGATIVGVSSEHLGLALARSVVFGVNTSITASRLYTTTKYGLDWVLSEIQKRYSGTNRRCIAVGGRRSRGDLAKMAEKYGWLLYDASKGGEDAFHQAVGSIVATCAASPLAPLHRPSLAAARQQQDRHKRQPDEQGGDGPRKRQPT